MLSRKKDKEAVKEFCNKVRKKFGSTIITIKLFGSKVFDNDTPESDIDIFIVVSEKIPVLNDAILDIAFEIDLKYNVYISPRIVPQSVMKNPVWINTPFIKNIERNGISL